MRSPTGSHLPASARPPRHPCSGSQESGPERAARLVAARTAAAHRAPRGTPCQHGPGVQTITDEAGIPPSCMNLRLRDPVHGRGGAVGTNERYLEPGRSRPVRRDVVSRAAHAHSEVRVWSLTIPGDGQMGSHADFRVFPVVQETSVKTVCRNMKRHAILQNSIT
jgi:hypothetical protein